MEINSKIKKIFIDCVSQYLVKCDKKHNANNSVMFFLCEDALDENGNQKHSTCLYTQYAIVQDGNVVQRVGDTIEDVNEEFEIDKVLNKNLNIFERNILSAKNINFGEVFPECLSIFCKQYARVKGEKLGIEIPLDWFVLCFQRSEKFGVFAKPYFVKANTPEMLHYLNENAVNISIDQIVSVAMKHIKL